MLSLYCYYKVKNRGGGCELGLQGRGDVRSPWHVFQAGLSPAAEPGGETIPGGEALGQKCFAEVLMQLLDASYCLLCFFSWIT